MRVIQAFEVPGEVVAKQRPRVTRNATYTPQKTKDYEELVRQCYSLKHKEMLEGELEITVKLYLKIPKSTSKKKRVQMECSQIRPVKKPDIDNCLKSITDALNKVAYADDSQIVRATIEKYYGEPRAEVILIGG